jgi:hypothetical protein
MQIVLYMCNVMTNYAEHHKRLVGCNQVNSIYHGSSDCELFTSKGKIYRRGQANVL